MIAAGRVAEDAMCRAISAASELRPRQTPLTEGQRRAWRKLAKEFGDELATLNINSARDIAEAGIKAQMAEAEKLMSNPTVRKAYEKFLFVAELTKEHKNADQS
jgi:predicted hydrocarbon binding protein